jgi:hypothetical protein
MQMATRFSIQNKMRYILGSKIMKKNIRFRFQVLVFILLFSVLCPLTSIRASTNFYLNFTAAQINTNIARVASSYPNWDTAYSWGSHTGLYATVSAWNATNAAQYAINTNLAAQIAAMVSNTTFVAYTNAQHAINTNLAAQIAAIPTNLTVSGLVSNSTFTAYTNAQHAINTNLAAQIAAVPTNSSAAVTNVQIVLPNEIALYTNSYNATNIVVQLPFTSYLNGVYSCSPGTTGTNADYYFGNQLVRETGGVWEFIGTSFGSTVCESTNSPSNPWEAQAWRFYAEPMIVVASNSPTSVIVSNSLIAALNGVYTSTNGLTGKDAVYVFGDYSIWGEPDYWNFSEIATMPDYYISAINASGDVPPWTNVIWGFANTVVYSNNFVFRQADEIKVADLLTSLQFVSAPTGSVAAGSSGQYSISADTNQYFYWYSPTAISAETTGVWLRVLGELF